MIGYEAAQNSYIRLLTHTHCRKVGRMFKLITRISIGLLSVLILALVFILPFRSIFAHAQTTPPSTDQITQLQTQIAQLQTLIDATKQQQQTLKTAVRLLNLNIQKNTKSITLTQTRIGQTSTQINSLSGNISTAAGKISVGQQGVASTLQQLDVFDAEPLAVLLLSGGTLSSFFNQEITLGIVRDSLNTQIQSLSVLKGNLQTTKSVDEQRRQQLTALQHTLTQQQQNLAAAKSAKTELLAETNNKQSNYERLLVAAKAQLASISAFAQNAGGSKLLGSQTSCDAWGCYYNQRDTSWGNDALNGTHFNLASDGCLITDMAMVLTHYGYRNVTPVTINSNPNNFAAYFPAYLLYTIYAGGATATRVVTSIDKTLATGNPVIVGIHAYGGTHFVVLVSGSRGNYIMRDPYVADGNNISFTSKYSLRSIYYVAKVEVS